MTTLQTSRIEQVLQQLNDYQDSHDPAACDGHDIWQDVIYGLPDYQQEATETLDPYQRGGVFVAGQVVYSYVSGGYGHPHGYWVAERDTNWEQLSSEGR
mgnify:CR=1 FL=1